MQVSGSRESRAFWLGPGAQGEETRLSVKTLEPLVSLRYCVLTKWVVRIRSRLCVCRNLTVKVSLDWQRQSSSGSKLLQHKMYYITCTLFSFPSPDPISHPFTFFTHNTFRSSRITILIIAIVDIVIVIYLFIYLFI